MKHIINKKGKNCKKKKMKKKRNKKGGQTCLLGCLRELLRHQSISNSS